jgi:hypothetical protein
MKKNSLFIGVLVIMLVIGISSVFAQSEGLQGTYKPITADERSKIDVLGKVSVKVQIAAPNLVALPKFTFDEAYVEILKEASVKYTGNIYSFRHEYIK